MSFDPLETDEILEKPAVRERDTDTVMLIGCSGFVATSLVTYCLVVWPYFVFSGIHLFDALMKASAFAMVPALVFGALSVRKFGLPSACGFVGGGMATAVFLFLRLTEVQIRRGNREMEQPDYPSLWVWALPCAWLIAVFFVAVLFIKKSEIEIGPSVPPSG